MSEGYLKNICFDSLILLITLRLREEDCCVWCHISGLLAPTWSFKKNMPMGNVLPDDILENVQKNG